MKGLDKIPKQSKFSSTTLVVMIKRFVFFASEVCGSSMFLKLNAI